MDAGQHYLLFNDVWRSDDLGSTWSMCSSQASWSVRAGMSVLYIEGTIILMGGSAGCKDIIIIYI
jgi:hypothetical protein